MFDGIDSLVLPVRDTRAVLPLYRDHLGFQVERTPPPDPAWGTLWGLPSAPSCLTRLTKPGANGGAVWIAEVPDLPEPLPVGGPHRPGPYALDFYLRDAESTEQALVDAGYEFVSEAVHYLLPGTPHPVRERMLHQPHSGLLHACVQYRPGRTRCVLARTDDATSSEVVAAVFLTHDLAGASAFAREVLGAEEYFTGRFDGPAVEQMLGLDPGAGLEMALFRGPQSRNARLEFARVIPRAVPSSDEAPDPAPRVIAQCLVDDLEGLSERLRSSGHGVVTGDEEVAGRRRVGFATTYGATFTFSAR